MDCPRRWWLGLSWGEARRGNAVLAGCDAGILSGACRGCISGCSLYGHLTLNWSLESRILAGLLMEFGMVLLRLDSSSKERESVSVQCHGPSVSAGCDFRYPFRHPTASDDYMN